MLDSGGLSKFCHHDKHFLIFDILDHSLTEEENSVRVLNFEITSLEIDIKP